MIVEHQTRVEESAGKMKPIWIYPGGGTTNGSAILKFKRGALVGEKKVRPVVMMLDLEATVSIAYDVVDFLPIGFLQCCWPFF